MKRFVHCLWVTSLLALIPLASAQDEAPAESPAEGPGKQVPAKANVVEGHIRYDGEKPKVKPLTVAAAQAKGCCSEGEQVDDADRSLLVGDKLGLANVVVSLTVPEVDVKVSKDPVVYDQTGCRFEPHVMVVPAGSKVRFTNSDSCVHNVHLYCFKNTGFNRAVPSGKHADLVLPRAESVKVTCDIHPWMSGYVVVTEATHWAITGPDGSFSLKGVPAGTYELTLWHEKLGKGKSQVTVAEDGTCDAVELKMAPKKPRRRRR